MEGQSARRCTNHSYSPLSVASNPAQFKNFQIWRCANCNRMGSRSVSPICTSTIDPYSPLLGVNKLRPLAHNLHHQQHCEPHQASAVDLGALHGAMAASRKLAVWGVALCILMCRMPVARAQTGNLFGQTFTGDVSDLLLILRQEYPNIL